MVMVRPDNCRYTLGLEWEMYTISIFVRLYLIHGGESFCSNREAGHLQAHALSCRTGYGADIEAVPSHAHGSLGFSVQFPHMRLQLMLDLQRMRSN